MERKLVIAGVGGQGVVLVTRLLTRAASSLGHPVMASETHGMSQRGGSVVSHLKVGGSEAPLIQKGTADALLALAPEEAVRNLPYVRRGGSVFVSSGPAPGAGAEDTPGGVDRSAAGAALGASLSEATAGVDSLASAVAAGAGSWAELSQHLDRLCISVRAVPAGRMALELGNPAVANVALVGYAIAFPELPLPYDTVRRAVESMVPRSLELNLTALERGYRRGQSDLRSEARSSPTASGEPT